MGFHITQPGSSVATSLIDGEAKPKHVLLLEIKVLLKALLFMLNKTSVWCFLIPFLFLNRETSIGQPKYL
jgi:hypothetical protein